MIKNKTILLVEDDFINMKLVQHILEAEGYTVLKAVTAREALDQIETVVPDLILMDMQLPDIDGTTVVRILREKPATRNIKILAVTAYAMKGDRERILQMGCEGYIPKPIDVQNFIKTVSSFLNPATK